MSPTNKIVLYFIGLILILASLELIVRFNESSIISLQDKMFVKQQMYQLRKKTDVLFIGSSRTQDSIESGVVESVFGEGGATVFNGATSGANINKLEYIANKVVQKKDLKLLVLELSIPQTQEKPLGLTATTELKPKDLEEKLQKVLSENIYLVKYRKTFRLDSFRRMPLLLFSDFKFAENFFRRAALKDLFIPPDQKIIDEGGESKNWFPDLIEGAELLKLSKHQKKVLGIYKTIASKAKANGTNVVLLAPPLANGIDNKECEKSQLDFYRHISKALSVRLYGKICSKLSMKFFRDESHLNKEGRYLWSTWVAESIKYHIGENPDAL